MKKIALLTVGLLLSLTTMGQVKGTETTDKKTTNIESEEEPVFIRVEEDPEFPGGMEGLIKYLTENIHYPEEAKAREITGKVFVSFVVERDGSVSSAKVLRDIGGGCGEEALRVVQEMPKWTPGKQSGKPVRVQYNLPLNFSL